MAKKPRYPFVPKSTAWMEPGQFWSIPLDCGGYACGRVIQMALVDGKRQSRMFLAGLMDWCGDELPTGDSLVGCKVIRQSSVHIKTISENRGEMLGVRPLELDGIEPDLFRDAESATYVKRGYDYLRPFDRKRDTTLPVFRTSGYGVMRLLAEKHFGGKKSRAVRK